MEILTVGKVLVPARIENLFDLKAVEEGRLTSEQVRRVEITEALVDTGATYLSLPRRLINELGLTLIETKIARTTAGPVSFGVYEPVRLTVQGRDCEIRVSEVPDSCPVLIGFIPLEMLDFVVDPKGQRLIGNPEHGGDWMIDMF